MCPSTVQSEGPRVCCQPLQSNAESVRMETEVEAEVLGVLNGPRGRSDWNHGSQDSDSRDIASAGRCVILGQHVPHDSRPQY